MNIGSKKFLARARLADQENAGIRLRNPGSLFHNMAEDGAGTNHAWRIAHDFTELLVLFSEGGLLQGILEDDQDAVARQRLLEKIKRAASRRLNGVGNAAVSGDHDDWRVIVVLAKKPQKVDAIAVGKFYVQQIRIGAPVRSIAPKFLRRPTGRNGIPFAFQNEPQRWANVGLVIHDNDAFSHLHYAFCRVRRNPAPPILPGTSPRSPLHTSASFRAMESPSPMPRFLKLIEGSKSVLSASSLIPGPESWTSITT